MDTQDAFDQMAKLSDSWKLAFEERREAHQRLFSILTWAVDDVRMPVDLGGEILVRIETALAREKADMARVS